MGEWVKIENGDIRAGDVVKFWQSVWIKRGAKGHGKGVYVGERLTTIQIEKVADGWVHGVVLGCEVGVSKVHRREVEKLKEGEKITRGYRTLIKGEGKRLLWEPESSRSVLVSHFLGNVEHERWMAMETDEE